MKSFFLLFLITLAGCRVDDVSESQYFWLDTKVSEKLLNASEETHLTRPRLDFTGGSAAINCSQYFESEGDLVETTANFSSRSHYLICDALKLAETWPFKAGNKRFEHNLALCSTIDLGSFRHSLRPRIQNDGATLSDLFGTEVIENRSSCGHEGEGLNFYLTGVLLVKEPRKPQRLWVWLTDEVLGASYRAYTPLWFVFDENSGRWIAEQ